MNLNARAADELHRRPVGAEHIKCVLANALEVHPAIDVEEVRVGLHNQVLAEAITARHKKPPSRGSANTNNSMTDQLSKDSLKRGP